MAEQQLTWEAAAKIAQQLVAKEVIPGFSVGGLEERVARLVIEGQGEKALEMMAGEIVPYTEEDVKMVLKKNLSSEFRGQYGVKQEPRPGSPDRPRYDEAEKISIACLKYLTSEEGEIPPELTKAVASYLAQNPVFKDLLFDAQGNFKTTEAHAIANNLLRQPNVRRMIHKFFTERLDPTKRLEHEAVVERLQRELQILGTQVITKSEQEIISEIESKQAEKRKLEESMFQDNYYKTYLDFKREEQIIRLFLEEINQGKITPGSPEWGSRVKSLQLTSRVSSATDLTQVRNYLITRLAEIKRELTTNPDFDNIRKVEAEITRLDQEISQLQQEREKVNSRENRELLAQYYQKQQQLQEAQALLTAERVKYASEIASIPADAVKEYLDKALSSASQHFKEEAQKQAQKEEAEKRRLLESAIEKLGESLGRKRVEKRGERRYRPDKAKSRRLLVLLMQPGGVEKFMDSLVIRDRNGNIKEDSTRRKLRSFGLTDDEANIFIQKMSDPEFIRNTGIELAKKVLADYFLAGGRLSREDIVALGNSPWVKDLIEEGLKIAQEKRQQIESLLGKGVLRPLDEIRQGKTTREWIGDNWKKFGLAIILILLLLGLGVWGVSRG